MPYSISVIIPLYNVEKYISKCLDSVVNQTLGIDNIEVIIVNDCSQDNSVDIVQRYVEQYPSIQLYHHKENAGLGAARNTGLEYVTTDYITFLDSDDFISLNAYEIVLEKMVTCSCDLLIFEYEYYSEVGKTYKRNPSAKLFTEDKIITDISKHEEIIYSMSVCNKVFSKKHKTLLKFPQMTFEDTLVSTLTTFNAQRIYITNECKYFYRKREELGSITDNFLNERKNYFDHAQLNISMHNLISEYPEYRSLLEWFNARSSVPFIYNMVNQRFLSIRDKKELFYKFKETLKDVTDETIVRLESKLKQKVVKAIKRKWFVTFCIIIVGVKLLNLISKFSELMLNKFTKLSKKLMKVMELGMFLVISFFFKFNRKYKDVWLICERGFEAKDNGYHFFVYLRQHHADINAYYLLDCNDESELKKLKHLGNTVHYKGFRHKVLFFLANKLITAHKGTIEPWNYHIFRKVFPFITKKQYYIFLQHGITKDDVSDALGKKNTNFNLFISGAEPEYNYIIENFGYSKKEVAYTGFARFDSLDSGDLKNHILVMPTWRKGIVQPTWLQSREISDDIFLESTYYKSFQSLINNYELIKLLNNNYLKLIFYPHHEVQQYLSFFSSNDESIVLANQKDFDVQQLLRESKLLITDFSSVFFDFAYMGKPVVYYQFDRDSFFSSHYKKGYFDYYKDGFGPVLKNETEIVKAVSDIINNNFKIEHKYQSNIDAFFPKRDRNNCKRIFDEIIKLN